MEANKPGPLAELTEAFERYERALVANDLETLDELFWDSADVVRYGPAEALYGREEILAFRKARPAAGLARERFRTVVVTFGDDFGSTSTEFRRDGSNRVGRQSQSWARLAEGWRIVAAHVSLKEP